MKIIAGFLVGILLGAGVGWWMAGMQKPPTKTLEPALTSEPPEPQEVSLSVVKIDPKKPPSKTQVDQLESLNEKDLALAKPLDDSFAKNFLGKRSGALHWVGGTKADWKVNLELELAKSHFLKVTVFDDQGRKVHEHVKVGNVKIDLSVLGEGLLIKMQDLVLKLKYIEPADLLVGEYFEQQSPGVWAPMGIVSLRRY
jgi:hypothetical protein